jgi:hypothetical protein
MNRIASRACHRTTSTDAKRDFLRPQMPGCFFQSASRRYGVAERRRRSGFLLKDPVAGVNKTINKEPAQKKLSCEILIESTTFSSKSEPYRNLQ